MLFSSTLNRLCLLAACELDLDWILDYRDFSRSVAHVPFLNLSSIFPPAVPQSVICLSKFNPLSSNHLSDNLIIQRPNQDIHNGGECNSFPGLHLASA